jgi:hypothetical protein
MNPKHFNAIRRKIGSKPDHFKGGEKEWGRLIRALLTPPNPSKTWVKIETKNKKGQVVTSRWERV